MGVATKSPLKWQASCQEERGQGWFDPHEGSWPRSKVKLEPLCLPFVLAALKLLAA